MPDALRSGDRDRSARERWQVDDGRLTGASFAIDSAIYAIDGGSAFGVMYGTQHIYRHFPVAGPETSVPAEDGQKHQSGSGA